MNPRPRRIPRTVVRALLFGCTAALALLVLARNASAETTAYAKISSQKLGTIDGASTRPGHSGEFEVAAFSVAPTTGAAPATFVITVALDALPSVFQAMTTQDPIRMELSVYKPDAAGISKLAYEVSAVGAMVTDIQASSPTMSMDLTLSTPVPLHYTDASGAQPPGGDIPPVTAPRSRQETRVIKADKLVLGGSVAPSTSFLSLTWHASAAKIGNRVVMSMVLTKTPDAASDKLHAAASTGAPIDGTIIDLHHLASDGSHQSFIEFTFESHARFAPPGRDGSRSAAKGTETYTVEFAPPVAPNKNVEIENEVSRTVSGY